MAEATGSAGPTLGLLWLGSKERGHQSCGLYSLEGVTCLGRFQTEAQHDRDDGERHPFHNVILRAVLCSQFLIVKNVL